MPLSTVGEIVGNASAGVGAFNVVHLEHAEAVVAGAESVGLPVVLQISENCVAYHGALAPIAVAALSVAEAAEVPVAVHLDHATRSDLVHEAIAIGLGSVMYDASGTDYADNVRVTAQVVAHCHRHGVWVEAELGEVGGKDGVHDPGSRTDPAAAAAYVGTTGVDALAVAVGTSHAMLSRDARLDFALIETLRDHVPVPLVLHGSSGVPDGDLARATRAGMKKINIGTQLNKVFTAAVRDFLAADLGAVDSRKYLGAGRDAVRAEVARLLAIIG
ncbi:MAG: class II fructose-bisphosphate aldolase family protein [Kutzneria sp.]|nr:class II fructose-bisphosphate aldolase family protein [Kutzneria sp.]MBV9846117.1 class II fructose-bisphosphate aldolase family protein [Kutzneria sp.]